MRRIAFMLIFALLLGSIYLVERRGSSGRVGLGPIMRLVADLQRQAERIPLTATRVSHAEERDIGSRMVHNYRLAEHSEPISPEAEAIEKYLNQVGEHLSRHVQRQDIPYHFYLRDEDRFVNAFALPGGHIVMGRGLLNLMESEDELAAVLGHEIAHVDRRHCIERLQYELAARKLGLSLPFALASLPIDLFQAGYNKDLELEADRVGVSCAVAAGYSPQGAIELFQRFEKKYPSVQNRSSTPVGEITRVALSAPEEYFLSHPPPTERIAEVEREIRAHRWKLGPVQPLRVQAHL